MYGFRSDILFLVFFCHLIYACLCGSIALILQYKDKATQRDGIKKKKAVWGDIESQVNSTAGTSTELKCFPLWIPLFLDAENEDVEMESQNLGTVQL